MESAEPTIAVVMDVHYHVSIEKMMAMCLTAACLVLIDIPVVDVGHAGLQ